MRNSISKLRIIIYLFMLCVCLLSSHFVIPAACSTSSNETRHSHSTFNQIYKSKPTLKLSEFEEKVKAAPNVLAATAELEESLALLEQVQAESGLKLFSSNGMEISREQSESGMMLDYQRINLKAGIRYPLFGSKNIERKNILEVEALEEEKRYQKEQVYMESILAVRMNYINYWAANEKEKISRFFLENEAEISRILNERTQKGHLLDSDRQEFLTTFLLVRRNLSQVKVVKQRALSVLGLLTGSSVEEFNPQFPGLSMPDLDLGRLKAKILAENPQINSLKSNVDEKLKQVELSGASHRKSSLILASNVSYDISSTQPDYGISMEFRVDFPLRLKQAESAHRRAALAALKKSQLELESTSLKIFIEVEEALNQISGSQNNINFSLRRVQAAQERVREGLLRYAFLPGDVIEKVLQARFEYYKASIDFITTHAQRLMHIAKLLSYIPESSDFSASSNNAIGTAPENIVDHHLLSTPPDSILLHHEKLKTKSELYSEHTAIQDHDAFAVYVWDSNDLFHQYFENQNLFGLLKAWNISRLLVSFTNQQINDLMNPLIRRRLETIISESERHGIRIDLLLGEPLWILPKHRQKLLALIGKLSDFPFKGIHLDLEPNQLEGEKFSESFLLEQLILTLQAAINVSRIPIGLSIHFRYLEPDRYDICFGCALENIDLEEVTLMIYVTNPIRVAQIARKILDNFPNVHFSLAQSVEPILAKEESYATYSSKEFLIKMKQLRSELNYDNFNNIFIQSWEDLQRMKP